MDKIISIDDIRGKDFDLYRGKSVNIEGFVCSKSMTEIIAKAIVFKCPECSTEINIEQNSTTIQKPKECVCGRRGYFNTHDVIKIDVGTLIITNPFSDTPRQIKIVVSDDGTSPHIWNEIQMGTKISVDGSIDVEIGKKALIPYVRTKKLNAVGKLSEEDKMKIAENYFTTNLSIPLEKFYNDMTSRCLVYADIRVVLEKFCSLGKIDYWADAGRVVVLPKIDATGQDGSNKRNPN